MSTPTNFYATMFGMDEKTAEKTAEDQAVVVQDEAIGKPWTKKYIIYVNAPKENFSHTLQAMDGVVAVFEKVREEKATTSDSSVPNN